MVRQKVVIVDYGLGNQTSVQRMVRNLGHHCIITADKDRIAQADLAILPGVGAFPTAMKMLHHNQLVDVLVERAQTNSPILGICLGMQLLADSSEEFGLTQGLGLIPGKIKLLKGPRWHIGWNTIEVKEGNKILQLAEERTFFFNHSYVYEGSNEHVIALVDISGPIPAAICHDRVAGVQFHPEKSQEAGRLFFASLINHLCQ